MYLYVEQNIIAAAFQLNSKFLFNLIVDPLVWIDYQIEQKSSDCLTHNIR